MKSIDRRKRILEILSNNKTPISASKLAKKFSVSRQIIVGDVALLRAEEYNIESTSRGYILNNKCDYPYEGIVVCKHDMNKMEDELNTIVDFGGVCVDVRIDHIMFGELVGKLNISSRYEVSLFINKVVETSKPLSILTEGIHAHKIGCKDEDIFKLIKNKLKEKGYLYNECY